MHDINGKTLYVGDSIRTNAFGIVKIIEVISDDHNNDLEGGANVKVSKPVDSDFNMRLLRNGARKVWTMKAMAESALLAQSACNFTGIFHSLNEMLEDLRDHLKERYRGEFCTPMIATHPIVFLFMTQFAYLAGGSFETDEIKAYYFLYSNWASKQKDSDAMIDPPSEWLELVNSMRR